MKILVTGSGGFLGSRIAGLLLEKGYEVRGYGRSPQSKNAARGVDVVQGGLGDADAVSQAVKGCDAVFHVAAKAGVWGREEEFYEANVTGARNVLKACQQHGVERLVYTSTPSVTFSGEAFEGANESLPLNPSNELSPYARTKAIAEGELLAAHGEAGVRICALRPHLIWGVGDPHLVPRVVAKAKTGRLRIVGEGGNRVDLTHVDNAAAAHLLAFDALNHGTCGGRAYFLSDGEPVVLWDWINDLLRRVGVPPIEKKISAKAATQIGGVCEWGWGAFGLKGEPPMTRFVATELSKSHWFSIDAARRDFGYKPKVDLDKALQDVVADLQSRC
ncbi:NAD-dependent epimerase/dehydratase family protein [Cerasicoccus frondis]|uniref:NAD-dependent epimerase/dehydratase family protein n=1 Tax=Cerasicoccus frondis TaxID=490090 RepID=UPI002852BF15|nr:NAD-dependent epimerase/dehydratase family protein [Cerasicoccus frondis]